MTGESAVIVVGSGASGVMAAHRLLDGCLDVLMLDAGSIDDRYAGTIPQLPYADLRRNDKDQHTYLLGFEYEGVDIGKTGPLAQVTTTRQHVFRRAAEWLHVKSDGFTAVESLAPGGLAEAWGAVSFPFTESELRRCALDPVEMAQHYESVAALIGISGERDDLTPWRGALDTLQPSLPPDPNAAAILARYERHRERFQHRGLRMGRALLAMLSKPLGARERNPEYGLDYWNNLGDSVFRPSLMLRLLRCRPNFLCRHGILVTRFRESPRELVEVEGIDLGSRSKVVFRGRQVVLAAGALGTTRIVLRSLDRYNTPTPLTCNEHAYIPSIRLAGVGAPLPERAHALAQLTAMYDPSGDQEHLAQAQIYSFTGLPLARLLKESPLPYRESIQIFAALATSFVILVTQYEALPSPTKWCVLRHGASDEEDVLEIGYRVSSQELETQRSAERAFSSALRTSGCWPLRVVRPGPGASVHYGGTLPLSIADQPLTLARDGRLRETRRVYVADGAGLPYLPAKGPTLTLMANAYRVAERIVERRA
ncbi:MAG: GMC oxidoreductase [Candidatus Binatia bacterium]